MRAALVMMSAALLLGAVSCRKEEVKERLYFGDLTPPVGAGKVEVILDQSDNPTTGGEITVKAVINPDIDKDELDRLLLGFYRQAEKRRGFQVKGKPVKIDVRLYDNSGKAEAGGDDYLGRAFINNGDPEATYENKQKAPLLKWAKKAIGKDAAFTKDKVQILGDPKAMELDVTMPMVEYDGTGNYKEHVTFEKFSTEWSSTVIALFEKIPGLKQIAFSAKHHDKIVAKIVITRELYDKIDLKQMEESLGAFVGQFYQDLVSQKLTSEKVEQMVKEQRRKIYKEALDTFPEGAVAIDKDLYEDKKPKKGKKGKK